MDPVLVAGVQFLLAILSGAFVALLAQHFASQNAAEQQRRAREERHGSMRRALIAEVRENMHRLGGPDPARPPGVPIVRIAWDAARALAIPVDAFDALARAYAAGEEVSRGVELVNRRAMSTGIVLSRSAELEAHEKAKRILTRDAGVAFAAFRDAL